LEPLEVPALWQVWTANCIDAVEAGQAIIGTTWGFCEVRSKKPNTATVKGCAVPGANPHALNPRKIWTNIVGEIRTPTARCERSLVKKHLK